MATPLVRAAALVDFPRLVSEFGVDPQPLLSTLSLSVEHLDDPDEMIPGGAVDQLLRLGAEATECEHFGALLGQRRDLHAYLGTLGQAIWTAPDLRAAISRLTAHVSAHVEGSRWTLDVDGGLARLRNETFCPASVLQAAGHNLVLLNRLLRVVTSDRWRPSLAYFACSEPCDSFEYRRLLACPVLFNQEVNALVFHATDLDIELPTSDCQLSDILLRHVALGDRTPQDDLIGEVERLVEKNLLAGVRSIEAVARFLPHSRSTLQQRLTDLGTSHQQILDEVRDRWAKDRLENTSVPVAEIAQTVGYRSADSFGAAFKRRNGIPPRTWRKRANRWRSITMTESDSRNAPTRRIREMVEADGEWAASLLAERRREYETYSPIFWRQNREEGVVEAHGLFLGSLISDPESVAVRCDEGFAIATPHGGGYYVDDFAVGDGAWMELGSALLLAIWSTIEPQAEYLRVVTARRDAAKVAMLESLGLNVAERWWVKPVHPGPGSGSGPSAGEPGHDADARFHIHRTEAPPVYCPGGPVGIVTGFASSEALADAETAAAGSDLVLLVAPLAPYSAGEVHVEAAGFEAASEFYVGTPTG